MLLIAAVIAVAAAAGVGVQARFGDRAITLAQRILAAMLYVLVPPVVFFNLVGLELTADVGVGLVLAWLAVVIVGLVAYQVATRVLHLDRPRTGTFVNAALHPNTGYLGLPVVAVALGTEHLEEAVVYDVLVGTPTLLLGAFAVGAAFGTKAGETVRDRMRAFLTRNPPLIAGALGLLAPAALAPEVLVDASRVLVFTLLPLGFFALGITLASERATAAVPREVGAALAMRLVLAPALLLAIAAPLIDLPDAYLVAAAMPTGLNGLIVAHAYGLDVGLAARAIAYGTAIALTVGVGIDLLSG